MRDQVSPDRHVRPGRAAVPVISIVGTSGSGKTTLLEELLPELRRRGYAVAVVKHHPHPGLETDQRGKDTWRLRLAGADRVVLVTPDQVVQWKRVDAEPSLQQVLGEIRGVDLVLTEGFKLESTPKIEVNRRDHCPTLLSPPEELIAVVSDQTFDVAAPHLSLRDISGLADLIERLLLSAVRPPQR